MSLIDHYDDHLRQQAARVTVLRGCELLYRTARQGRGITAEDARQPRDARQTCTQTAIQWGLSHLEESVGLLVSELMTNAFAHGVSPYVRLRIWLTDDYLWLEVWAGSSASLQQHDPGGYATGGRGLGIVDWVVGECCGAWGRTEDKKATWCQIPVRPELVAA
ncbi:ATP-binding protein [Streptomyces sp. L-9-10]|uniref:ATP-binding protein n=1 Tax=Streptomyces sp. L-9-10 TaxID=1478131 RepID=UPI00101C0170|nr:ATP-binding protein [Streptomyces sp. L-9-10]